MRELYLGPLTPTSPTCFINHNIKTSIQNDRRLAPSVIAKAPQYQRDFRRKMRSFRSHTALRRPIGELYIKVRRNDIFEGSYQEIMRHSSTDLKKMLMIEFEGESAFDDGSVSRSVALCMIHERRDLTNMLTENSSSYSHMRYSTGSTACLSTLQITTPSRSPRV